MPQHEMQSGISPSTLKEYVPALTGVYLVRSSSKTRLVWIWSSLSGLDKAIEISLSALSCLPRTCSLKITIGMCHVTLLAIVVVLDIEDGCRVSADLSGLFKSSEAHRRGQ